MCVCAADVQYNLGIGGRLYRYYIYMYIYIYIYTWGVYLGIVGRGACALLLALLSLACVRGCFTVV